MDCLLVADVVSVLSAPCRSPQFAIADTADTMAERSLALWVSSPESVVACDWAKGWDDGVVLDEVDVELDDVEGCDLLAAPFV